MVMRLWTSITAQARARFLSNLDVPRTSHQLITTLTLQHRSLFTLEHIADFQCETMEYYKDNAVRIEWVRDFTYGYSLEELYKKFNDNY